MDEPADNLPLRNSQTSDHGDEKVFIRVLFAMILLVLICAAITMVTGGLPVFGQLPGDITLPSDSGERWFPVGSSVLIASGIVAVAVIIERAFSHKQ